MFTFGDWRFFWPDTILNLSGLPSAWDSILNTGLGTPSLQIIWLNSYLNLTSSISSLGISWTIVSIVFWFIPIFLIGFFSSKALFNYIFPKNNLVSLVAGFIFIFNTYFLLIFSGGQMGVAFGYGLFPFVLLSFLKLLDSLNLRESILFGLAFSLLMLFDPRFAYMQLFVFIFILIADSRKIYLSKIFYTRIIFSFLLVFLIHSFWILPVIFFPMPLLAQGFGSLKQVAFFSFANFSNGFSLLHPNWPENIFGKIYFFKPEFIFIPFIAFSSIFFIQKQNKSWVMRLSLLAVIGAFFVKGTNEPFGRFYVFLLSHIPGFFVFRDPSKFFLLVSIAYAMLIPFTLSSLVKKYHKKSIYLKILSVFFIFFWLILLRQFSVKNILPKEVPEEYIALKNFIAGKPQFFRTLWMPSRQRFAYFTLNHPAIDNSELPKLNEKLLQDFEVKYIIVPSDTSGEIFTSDHKYSREIYRNYLASVSAIPYVHFERKFGNIQVFALNSLFNDHLQVLGKGKVNFVMKSQDLYTLTLKNVSRGDLLIFSEKYNPYWVIKFQDKTIYPQKNNGIMSFALEKGAYKAELYYLPQTFVNIGLVISGFTLLISFFLMLKYA